MGRHYQMTEEERAEARRAYRKAYYAKKREEFLAAREIARGLGCPERKRGRPRLSDEERLERRRERQRKYYERKVGHPVVHFTDEERKAHERERYANRQAKLGKTVTPRPKLTPEERLERRRERQRAYQKKRTEAARKWRELKAQAVREGLESDETRTDSILRPLEENGRLARPLSAMG